MDLQDLLSKPPVIHRLATGEPNPVGLIGEVLSFIDEHVGEGSVTLETGAGLSTVLFALKGARHTCVVPFQYEVDRIVEYCAQHGIPTADVTFRVERSEDVLPRLDLPALDLVLIDGNHGFPAPFIDWYYTAGRLRIGGSLIVDDTHVWTGDVLKNFLLSEPEWELEGEFQGKAAVFRKIKEGDLAKEWDRQPYVVDQSRPLMTPVVVAPPPPPPHAPPPAAPRYNFARRGKRALGHLIRGEFSTLIRKVTG